MNIKELKRHLEELPEDLEVKALANNIDNPYALTKDNLLHTSETAFVDSDAPEEQWDCEDGKISLGSGKQYLLINAILH